MWRSYRWLHERHPRTQAATSAARGTLLLAFFFGVASLMLVGVFLLAAYQAYANDLTPPAAVIAQRPQPSKLYDRNGELLYQFTGSSAGGYSDTVPLDQISPYMVAATIATEDPTFYSNPGVSLTGVGRALVSNLPQPLGSGPGKGSGGSTITEQLAKNLYTKPSGNLFDRVKQKFKEILISFRLKHDYSNDQILGWYLNQTFYGNNANGAEAAAQRYFGKHAKDLDLAQAAMLAGVPASPAGYTPTIAGNQERAIQRQHQVLDLMLKHANDIRSIVTITPAQIQAAKAEPLTYASTDTGINAPHFVFYVQNELTKMCKKGMFQPPVGASCDNLAQHGGLSVATTLDLGLQHIGEQVVAQSIAANEGWTNGHDGSLVAIDPSTGQILTYVGSRDFFRQDIKGNVDINTSLRSHGSTMKPFTYITAFERGWSPSSYVDDSKLTIPDAGGTTHQVNDWDYKYLGKITIRTALSQSVNTPAVRTVMAVGIPNMQDTAHKMGITDLQRADCGPTITLGSCDVKLLDMTYAYSVIDNNGLMKGQPTVENLPSGYRKLDPVSVTKISDSDGHVLYQYQASEQDQVIDPAYAYEITDILSKDAISWSGLTIGRPAATKTGTSEDFKDNVVMGYTPNLVAGVWMGNADGTAMAINTFSHAGTGPMWRQFMMQATSYLKLPPVPFTPPSDIIRQSCGGHQEVFAQNQVHSGIAGACRPGSSSGGSSSGSSAPPSALPVFPRRPHGRGH